MSSFYGNVKPKLQTVTVNAQQAARDISPSNGYDGISSVHINAMSPAQFDFKVQPVIHDSGYSLDQTKAYIETEVWATQAGYTAYHDATGIEVPIQSEAAKTIVPTDSQQIAVDAHKWTTGQIKVAAAQGNNVIVANSLPNEGQQNKYYLVTGTPVKVYTWDGSSFDEESPVIETKTVYMRLVNETGHEVPNFMIAPVLTSDTDFNATTASLSPDAVEQTAVHMIAPYTWTLVFQSMSTESEPSYNVIGEIYNSNSDQWTALDAGFKYVGSTLASGSETLYQHFYLMNKIGNYTTPLTANGHLRFRCINTLD